MGEVIVASKGFSVLKKVPASPLKSLILIGYVLVGSMVTRGENIYVAQNAQGTDTGTDAADAHSVVWFNTVGNWSSPDKIAGKIGPGDTVHLCGTIETGLLIKTGGTEAGGAITILFEPDAKMSASYWPVIYPYNDAMVFNNCDYITIDGGANGVIECTDNGTNLAYKLPCSGIHFKGGDHVTVRNLTVRNLYVHEGLEDETLSVNGAKGIWCDTYFGTQANITDLTIENCILHDMCAGISMGYHQDGTRDITIRGNDIYNCNFGMQGGGNNDTSYAERLYIYNNHFHDWATWDTDNNGYHHNGIYIWSTKVNQHLDDCHFYNNTFGPGYTFHNTSGLFMGANYTSAYVYNNLFILDAADDGPMNGLLYGSPNSACTLSMVQHYYNNTFIGVGKNKAPISCSYGQSAGPGSRYIVKNNLVYDFSYGLGRSSAGEPDRMPLTAEHNLYYRDAGVTFGYSIDGVGHFFTWSGWHDLGYDTTGSIYGSDPLLDSEYYPQAASPARNAGTNLSQYFSTDFNGKPRPATGAWDIGAFQYTVSSVADGMPYGTPRPASAGSAQYYTMTGQKIGLHTSLPNGVYLVTDPVDGRLRKQVIVR